MPTVNVVFVHVQLLVINVLSSSSTVVARHA